MTLLLFGAPAGPKPPVVTAQGVPTPLFFGCDSLITFDAGSENWRSVSTTGGDDVYIDYGIAGWTATEGNPGGAIRDVDGDGQWQELWTPDLEANGYSTDYSHAFGGVLRFDYRNTTGVSYDIYVAMRGANGESYFFVFRAQITNSLQWTTVLVPMDPDEWVTGFNNGTGPTGSDHPTMGEFLAVLGDLDHFAFSIEGRTGSDITYFDNFGGHCVLDITKTASTDEALPPDGAVTYTVTVTNVGDSPATGAVIQDAIPPGIAAWTWECAASGGAECPSDNGNGSLNETVEVFPVGGQLVYTIEATVDSDPPPVVVNTASVSLPAALCDDGSEAPCFATVINPPLPVISAVKSASPSGAVMPTGTVTYTLTVINVSAVDATDVAIQDAIPAGITGWDWNCEATGGATCPEPSGTGALDETVDTLPTGGQLVYTIVATVSEAPPTEIENTVSVDFEAGVCAGGSSPPCTSTLVKPLLPVVTIDKSVDQDVSAPGGTIVYRVRVTNVGPAVLSSPILVSDPLAPGLASGSWTCSATSGAACPTSSGSMPLSETVPGMPVGGRLLYTITATAGFSPQSVITNTARVTGDIACQTNPIHAPPCVDTTVVDIEFPEDDFSPGATPAPTLTATPTPSPTVTPTPPSAAESALIVPPQTGDGGLKGQR